MGKVGRTLIPDNTPPPPFVLPYVDIIQVYVWTFSWMVLSRLPRLTYPVPGSKIQLYWCGKRGGAEEREGGGGGVSLPFFPPTPPFPDRVRPIFAWLALFFSRPYCLKAWHTLILTKLWLAIFGCQWKPSTNSNLFCLPRRFYSPQGEGVTKNSFIPYGLVQPYPMDKSE